MTWQRSNDLTPDWFTEVLRRHGALSAGKVTEVSLATDMVHQGQVSRTARLHLQYSLDSAGDRPDRLIIKRTGSDLHPELRALPIREAEFYRSAAQFAEALPIPTCYSADFDETGQNVHVLLADLSDSHFQRPLPLPPSIRHCERIVKCLADLHATWWNHDDLGRTIGTRLSQAQAETRIKRLHNSAPAFYDFLGDALLPQQQQALENILRSDFLDRLTDRLCGLKRVTLIHGDAHSANLLLPKNPRRDKVCLIDWQLWDINVAMVDLAFLMALHWSAERRALLEKHLLRLYHRRLLEQGVTDYEWEAAWRDYRESVIIMALIPIGQHRRGSPTGVVWHGLQNSLAAFHDLDCTDLL